MGAEDSGGDGMKYRDWLIDDRSPSIKNGAVTLGPSCWSKNGLKITDRENFTPVERELADRIGTPATLEF